MTSFFPTSALALLLLSLGAPLAAQTERAPTLAQVPTQPHARPPLERSPFARPPQRATPEPTTPPPQHVRDPRSGISFDLPAGWNFSRHDGELSTFSLDARSSAPTSHLRAVADIAFNPFPLSTFSGALFYVSIAPHLSKRACADQATVPVPRKVESITLDGVPFSHGYDEHGAVCTEARDQIYTANRNGSCYRFDLVINTFCGGEVSGAKDMTPHELDAVRNRLESILSTVRFTSPQDVLHPRTDRAKID